MKSYGNLYPQLTSWYNLYEAWRKARKGKRGKAPAAAFEYDLETGRRPSERRRSLFLAAYAGEYKRCPPSVVASAKPGVGNS
jgi:hypothetical protein